VLQILGSAAKQETKIKGMQIRKKELKLTM
jgi:hypothetical protein